VFEGLHQNNPDKIVAGSIGAIVLAIVADLALRAVERAAAR
jgi:ABC-type proline/glycine betaine transport system permease subunit